MKDSILNKLATLEDRYEEVGLLLSTPEVVSDQNKFRELSREYAELEEIVKAYRNYKLQLENLKEAKSMLEEADSEMKELAEEEITSSTQALGLAESELNIMLLPKDPDDDKDVYLEVRAGTGGDEAAIFAGDLYRMYTRYADRKSWRVQLMNENTSEHGGYKEVIIKISGDNVYSKLKFESGAHRVQRVPKTESQGRIHTSACTVAVMPHIEEVGDVDINPSDLRIDTFRASGAGGQHVNKTDSAIRITHNPTGIVVECQEERSQHKNKAKALSYLQAKLLQVEKDKHRAKITETRRNLVGSGDRSERIRTYNYPQGRVTDHRINLTLYKLDELMEGSLDEVIGPLVKEHQADLLAEQAGE